jgi:hypothetical protein
MVLPHRTTFDTMWGIICCISPHNPPYILFPITSCNRHVSKENWITISIQEMETLGLHTSHSSDRLTCKTDVLCELSSIDYLNWII